MNIFLFLKSSTVFCSMELLIGYIKIFLLEMRGGQRGKNFYAIEGGCSKRTCAYVGEGAKFLPFLVCMH